MPVVIPAGYRQITAVLDGPGASGDLALVWGITAAGDEEDDSDAFAEWFQDWLMEQMFAAPITLREFRTLSGPRPGTPELVTPPDPLDPIAGNQGAQMLPVNNALLVFLNTALGAPRGRGRKYFPGVAEGIVGNDGRLDPASLAQYQASMDNAFTAAVGLPFDLVLLHGTGISATPAPTPITSFQVSPIMATQRTRLRD